MFFVSGAGNFTKKGAKNACRNIMKSWWAAGRIKQYATHSRPSTARGYCIQPSTSLHFYCSIIADLFLKHRITGMSYLWRLILNIMIPIIACTAISSISRVGNATYLAWRTRCLLRSSGGGRAAKVGGRAAARHATIFSMPRRVAAQ